MGERLPRNLLVGSRRALGRIARGSRWCWMSDMRGEWQLCLLSEPRLLTWQIHARTFPATISRLLIPWCGLFLDCCRGCIRPGDTRRSYRRSSCSTGFAGPTAISRSASTSIQQQLKVLAELLEYRNPGRTLILFGGTISVAQVHQQEQRIDLCYDYGELPTSSLPVATFSQSHPAFPPRSHLGALEQLELSPSQILPQHQVYNDSIGSDYITDLSLCYEYTLYLQLSACIS